MSHATLTIACALALACGPRAQLDKADEAVVAAAMLQLGARDEAKRAAAVDTLAGFVDRARDALAERLGDADATVRVGALRVFRRAPLQAPVRRVATLLRDEDAQVREEATLLLSALRPEGWVTELVTRLSIETDLRVLRQLIVALGGSGDDVAFTALVDWMASATDPALRKKTAQVLLGATGKRFGEDVEAWRGWLAAKRAEKK